VVAAATTRIFCNAQPPRAMGHGFLLFDLPAGRGKVPAGAGTLWLLSPPLRGYTPQARRDGGWKPPENHSSLKPCHEKQPHAACGGLQRLLLRPGAGTPGRDHFAERAPGDGVARATT